MNNNTNYKYVGKNISIHDAAAKANGRIKYTGDIVFGNMLYASLLLSPLPHAKIKNIDTSKAADLPGVFKIFHHFNSKPKKFNSHEWFEGHNVIKDEMLFPDTVRFVGDRVAAVLAGDIETARKAVELIKVEYEELPVYTDVEKVIDKNHRIHSVDEPFKEVVFEYGETENIFKKEESIIIEDRVETPKVHHAAMENHVCIAVPGCLDKITVFTPCQIPFAVRLVVAKLLDIPLNKVRIIVPPLGGSFGGKQEVVLETLCAYFAKETDRTVHLELTRNENILATRTRTKTIGYVKTAVDKNGEILARDIKAIIDTGAYTSNGASISAAMGKKIAKLYHIENQRYRAYTAHTNTPVGGAARGYGSPQIHAMTEINIDNAARKLNMDPVELRLKNLVVPYDNDLSGGPSLGNARVIDCVLEGKDRFNWSERRKICADSGKRYKRGVGMACAAHVNGYYNAFPDFTGLTLKMLEDGSLILNSGLHEMGCGTITTIKQIIAEILDIHTNKIEIADADTESAPHDQGSQASRGTFVCGACAKKIAESLKNLFKNEAAKILGCTRDDIIMQNEKIWNDNKSFEKFSYGELAAVIQRKNQRELIVTESYKSTANPSSYGVNFVEVEVDVYTGLVNAKEIVAVHDVGKAVNPGFVESQIHGGIQMGLGLALSEDIAVDSFGKPKGNSFSRYHLINAPDMPNINVYLIEKGEKPGPFGAKSIGEISTIPICPAVVNAVNFALDTNITTLPLKPERIVAAYQEKNKQV